MQDHAVANFAELTEAVRQEENEQVKILLLAALAEAGLTEAIPLLSENLRSASDQLRYWAEVGLEKVGTKEARTLLWDHRHQQ